MPKLWPFLPSSIVESLQFYTDVRRARSGEIRDSLKDATQTLTLNYVSQDREAARIEGLFSSNIADEWYVPLWHDMVRTNAAISAGSSTIEVGEFADFREGGRAAIIASDSLREVINIDTVGSGILTLPSGEDTENSYSAGAAVVPLVAALCPSGLQTSVKFAVTAYSVKFVSIEPVNLEAALLPTFNGFDVLEDPSVLLSDLGGSVSQALDFIDNGFGAFKIETQETYKRWRGTVSFADYTREERWERRQFLHRMRGRDRPFLLPTWKDDLAIASSASSGSSSLVIQKLTDTSSVLVGRYIQIDTGSGFIRRRINAASIGSTTITLTLSASHGQTILPSMVASFMYLVRFDQDSFEIDHVRTVDGFFSSFQASVLEVLA